MIRIIPLSCLALVTFVRLGLAQASDNSQRPDEHAQDRKAYLKLNRQIFARHEDPDSEKFHVSQPDKVSEIKSQLHKLVSQEIRAVLEKPSASARDLTASISALQGELNFANGWGTQATNTPFAEFFELDGVQSVAIGYVIIQGGEAIPNTQPYLEFYCRLNGTWQMKSQATTLSDFSGRTFSVARMNSGIADEAWFLAWGSTIGNPGTPLNIRLYAFDGNTVRTVWKRDDLVRGAVRVSRDSITMEFDREYQSLDPNNRVLETLHVTANGLQ